MARADLLFREISNVSSSDLPLSAFEVGRTTSLAHQEGNGFYYQLNNANILYRGKKSAGFRTCNLTCIAMILEAYGVNKTDTKDHINNTVLQKIATFYSKELNNRNLYDLRYPDFLQILAIYLCLGMKDVTDEKAIKQARDKAAVSITAWSFMEKITISFANLSFQVKSVFNGTVNKGLKALGWKTLKKIPVSSADKEKVITLATYKKTVSDSMNREKQSGFKVIVHQYNHFTVLLDVNASGVRIHNPGRRNGGNLQVSWEEARNLGMFSGFMRCGTDSNFVSQKVATTGSKITLKLGLSNDAILKNRQLSKQLGWDKYVYQINDFLLPYSGLSNVSLGEEAFADAVAKWQEKNGFTGRDIDGVIGPNTWNKLSKQLKITDNSSTTSLPKSSGTPDSKVPVLSNIAGKVAANDPVLVKINQYKDLIEAAGQKYGLHPAIIGAIIAAESGGDRYKKSAANYKGLMQAERTDDQFDPKTSIETGTKKFAAFKNKYIVPRLTKFGIDANKIEPKVLLSLIIASYNAGQVTVLKALEYAYKSGNWKNWLEPGNYRRALVFSRGYHTYDACSRKASAAEIEEAKRTRIAYSNWREKGNWQTYPDPPELHVLERDAPKVMMCWVKTKHENTPGYIAKFLKYV